jgi:antitoxin component YwqK of YwqJK toxin-antitoxin module
MKDNTMLLHTAIERITLLQEQYKSLRDSSLLSDNFEYFEYKRSGVQSSLKILENLLAEQTQPTINGVDDNGYPHGPWETYHDNGRLQYKGNYINGNKHGSWESYFDNGQLSSKGNYVDGNNHGSWESYWDNGQLSYKGNYVAGNRHGYWESYHYNGQLHSKGKYVNGKKHGYWEEYYFNGELPLKGYYDMGKRVNYNPDEFMELTLSEIAAQLNIPVDKLRIKK